MSYIRRFIEIHKPDYKTEEDVLFYQSIGCKGVERERPWDHLIITSSVFFVLVGLLLASFSKFAIFGCILGIYVFLDIYPLLTEDMERTRHNIRAIRVYSRKMGVREVNVDLERE